MLTRSMNTSAARSAPTRAGRRATTLSRWRACLGLLGVLLASLSGGAQATERYPEGLAGDVRPFPKPNAVFEYNRGVVMSDGLVLRINVYRPAAPGRYPVIVTHGPYGKDVAWQTAEPYREAWRKISANIPDLCKQSTCSFMRWEMPDPERWVPEGYVLVQADSRGSGKTAGLLDVFGVRETQDYKELIEWAAAQPWSSGKVGLLGISYYAMNQWQVAALQPKGLAAIIPWEGAFDAYRDVSYHGGILSSMFVPNWFKRQIVPNQRGNVAGALQDAVTDASAVGPALPSSVLETSRISMYDRMLANPFDGAYYRQRTADPSRIVVPTLSKGNWAGAGLHLRGNIEGFGQVATKDKWLRVHSGDHFTQFYLESGFQLQKAFFDRFLKGNADAFKNEPRVVVTVRDPIGGNRMRAGNAWPLEGTAFERWYLRADGGTLDNVPSPAVSTASYQARSAGLTFRLPTSTQSREFTGPLMARLWISSSTTDADLYVTLRLLDSTGKDVTFEGANAPAVPVAQGWLRLSHRELDAARSTPYRPVHAHREAAVVEPNKPYAADVEIWPTSIVVPPGYTLAVAVQGQDFAFPHITSGVFRGSAPFMHEGSDSRLYGGTQTLHTGGEYDSYLLLPAMPPDRPAVQTQR